MITARIEHMTDNNDHNIKLWEQAVGLLRDFWEDSGAELYQREANLSVENFIQGWASKTFIMVFAYKDGKPIGMGVGIQFGHLLYSSSHLVIEVLYSREPEAIKKILEEYKKFSEVAGVDKTYIPVHSRDNTLLNKVMQSGVVERHEVDDINQFSFKFK